MAAGVDTKTLHRLTVEEINSITAEAERIKFTHAVLGLIGGFLFGLCFLVAKVFLVAWMAGAWCYVAGSRGWRAGMGKPDKLPPLEVVLAENARLRAELSRVT
jgi:hypothetical protein